ncbi:S8 family serine peptidase [Streptomyces sp. 15-116A]|uniref:S8 family peptidase n=1 Tax=Streptomyces sp. 15-116A TaxID=2259035 RepID=UPI0021B37F1F|nr:S8 family serine peptidase [Streptomyces sp. 15-116A]MCT7351560.1 S8 family serine peptidase [Streptomyces sp. 15-116A]
MLLVSALVGAGGAGSASATDEPTGWVVVLKDGREDPEKLSEEQAGPLSVRVRHIYRSALRGYSVTATAQQAARIRADPRVASVTPDRVVHGADGENARQRPRQPVAFGEDLHREWHLFRTDAVRKAPGGGLTAHRPATVGVAVLDSGVDLDSPELNSEFGINCTESPHPADVYGHGTAVAGLIAARNNGGEVLGVAPGTKIWSVKVLGEDNSGTLSSIICGIDWVTANARAKNIRVANMSLLGPVAEEPEHQAIRAMTRAGVVTTASAGNGPFDFGPAQPAGFPEVLTVTAKDVHSRPWRNSGFAVREREIRHTISAPGVDIYVKTLPTNGFGCDNLGPGLCTTSGTSYSAPIAAGVVALCISSGQCTGSPAEIIQTVRRHAREHHLETDRRYGGSPALGDKYYGHLVWAGRY